MKDIFKKHQVKIAKETLKMSDAAATIMGGMTKKEAREILKISPDREKASVLHRWSK